jgi:hypothetical protein
MCEIAVGALSVGRGTVAPVSSSVSATSTASVRLRLKPANAQAAVFLRAAGARRSAFNWALGQIKANQDQWAAEATYDIPKPDRTRTFSHFDLVRRWDATKRAAAPSRRTPGHLPHSAWVTAARSNPPFLKAHGLVPVRVTVRARTSTLVGDTATADLIQ